jgi:site-specific recombinase XerD
MERIYTKIIIRKDQPRADGTMNIYLRVYIDGVKKMFSLGIAVDPAQFNERKEVVSGIVDKELEKLLNTVIQQAKIKAQKIVLAALVSGVELTHGQFRSSYLGVEEKGEFLQFFKNWLAGDEGVKAPATLKAYRTTLRHLTNYQEKIPISSLNPEWVDGFDKYLVRLKLDTNYITKTHKTVKACSTWLIGKGKLSEQPYRNFKFKTSKSEPEYLEVGELDALIDLYKSGKMKGQLLEVLRAFLFGCLAGGLRISDMKALDFGDIEGGMLVIKPIKTSKFLSVLKIPMGDVAKSIIEDARKDVLRAGRVFLIPSQDNITNRHLKTIGAEAGVKKSIHFHMSRHTFAMFYLTLGGAVQVLQKILGHGKLETTMQYVHIGHEQKVREMRNFDQAFSGKLAQRT